MVDQKIPIRKLSSGNKWRGRQQQWHGLGPLRLGEIHPHDGIGVRLRGRVQPLDIRAPAAGERGLDRNPRSQWQWLLEGRRKDGEEGLFPAACIQEMTIRCATPCRREDA
ncbi:hypothetical protein CEXT_536461 [Caerostris extrusa]|uniref:Uncharacterized protein n=1 Tax=Caerostris extrusa TaxID=172846 RepID=A0AAV4SE55_CAEEX|nr:hypothetical protein CEXT_536461 [Caerostris extrusa]